MGTSGYSPQMLQPLPRDHWHLLSSSTPKGTPSLYGNYRVYQNIFTHEQVQQYGILFQTNQQYDEYLATFCQRLNEQSIVNCRFINMQKCFGICGCGKYARVFIERIPIRLNQISKIQKDQIIYVVGSMLQGFEKLYKKYQYFRVRPQMVGIDREGRVKVWINPNFSKNQHYIPVDLDKGDINNDQQISSFQQDKIISDIIQLLQVGTPNLTLSSTDLLELIKTHKGHLTFKLVGQILEQYTKEHKIEQKHYFQSMLSLIHEKLNSSEDDLPEVSNCSIDGKSFTPIVTKHKIIYYLDPNQCSDGVFSCSSSSRQSKSGKGKRKPFLQKEPEVSLRSSKSMVSDPGSVHEHILQDRLLTPGPRCDINTPFHKDKPKIMFNYNNNTQNMIPKYFSDPNVHPFDKKNTFGVPLQTINFPTLQKSSSSKSQMISNSGNFIFSGLNGDYVLDKELMQDMQIILNSSNSQ